MDKAAAGCRQLCHFFHKPGGCRNGDSCHFYHDYNMANFPMFKQTCKFYGTSSGCFNGDSCRFLHVMRGNTSPDLSSLPELELIEDTDSIHRLNPSVSRGKEYSQQEVKERDESECPLLERISPVSFVGRVSPPVSFDERVSPTSMTDSLPELLEYQPEDSKDRNQEKEAFLSEADVSLPPVDCDAICGECGKKFKMTPKGQTPDQWDSLKAHYKEQIGNKEAQHVKFLQLDSRFKEDTFCGVCGSHFKDSAALISHLHNKGLRGKKLKKDHRLFFSSVVNTFVDRDMGIDDELDKDTLLLHLVHSYTGDDSTSPTGIEGTLTAMFFGGLVSRLSAMSLHGGHVAGAGGMMGFTEDEIDELACQGIKPWDSEAGAALDMLYDY